MAPYHILVLGGGLTGLSSAFHLSRRFPSSIISLLEKEHRLGGWVRSERIQIPINNANTASVVIEAGPRTLRPNAKSVLELIHLLKLEPSVITVPKTSSSARSRFLHIPDLGPGLVRIPSSVTELFSSPLGFALVSSIIRELFSRPNRLKGVEDESVDVFMTRRFGEDFARTFGSALAHGIYACDSRVLSVRAAFPQLWDAEEMGWGGVLRGVVRAALRPLKEKGDRTAYDLGNMEERMKGVAVYSFKDGVQTLTAALERHLKAQSNVSIYRGEEVKSVQILQDRSLLVTTSARTLTPTYIASTLPLPVLHTLLPARRLPHLVANTSSSVTVLNLVFDRPGTEIHPDGFGYLVPRPPGGYAAVDKDGPGILGTIFDSSSLGAQDVISTPEPSPGISKEMNMTKMTVMLGGPYTPSLSPSSSVSHFSEDDLKKVLTSLSRHLNRSLPYPVFWHAWENRECIPLLKVGHVGRMEEMRAELELGWSGRMEVVGAGVGGVSVGDCVEAGRRVGSRWERDGGEV